MTPSESEAAAALAVAAVEALAVERAYRGVLLGAVADAPRLADPDGRTVLVTLPLALVDAIDQHVAAAER